MPLTNAEHQKRWREKHPDKVRSYWRAYYHRNKERVTDCNKRRNKEVWKELRSSVITGYSGKCQCCGESRPEFLTLDHVNNDGNIERQLWDTKRIYKAAVEQGFPSRYQLLCFNCNISKHIYKQCPHNS